MGVIDDNFGTFIRIFIMLSQSNYSSVCAKDILLKLELNFFFIENCYLLAPIKVCKYELDEQPVFFL